MTPKLVPFGRNSAAAIFSIIFNENSQGIAEKSTIHGVKTAISRINNK